MNKLIPILEFKDIIIKSGKGSFLFDVNGKRYLDITGGQLCTVLGHSSKVLKKAVKKNLDEVQNLNNEFISLKCQNAANKLNQIASPIDVASVLLSTGAEANEFALRYAKSITSKNGVISFKRGYGGLSMGAQTITYGGVFTNPQVENVYSVNIPDEHASDFEIYECLNEFEKLCNDNADRIAVAVFEPIASVGGMVIPPKKYFEQIGLLCKKFEILLCFDECQTGFGRTGSWFYFQELGIYPDIITLSKGIGLGYPVAAVLFNLDSININELKITHYSSHQNDSFAAQIVLDGIDYISNKKILDRVSKMGEYFLNSLKTISDKNGIYSSARGRGLMIGMDISFGDDKDSRKFFKHFSDLCLNDGLIVQGCNAGKTIRFLPSYLIKKSEVDLCLKILKDVEISILS